MLEPAMFIGLGLVAAWAYLRYPRLRPASLLRAVAHVAASFIGFALLPAVLNAFLPLVHAHALRMSVILALLLSTLTYLLLSWVWLIARILQDLLRGPRGGHPVSAKS
jgi:Na+(H+)/acetate symporter ActP